jgi:hypothetical protein
MKDEKTICYKITRSITALEKAIKTGKLDVITLVRRLHTIRQQAQNMENGLKNRKKIMVREGFEEEYQLSKAKAKIPDGINTIYETDEERLDYKALFEITIKQDEKIVYQTSAHAGVVCIVEKIDDINEEGQIDGQTQKLMFGQPLAFWFAFDQLKIAVEAKGLEIMQSIKQAIEDKKFVNPDVKRKIIEAINRMEGIK